MFPNLCQPILFSFAATQLVALASEQLPTCLLASVRDSRTGQTAY